MIVSVDNENLRNVTDSQKEEIILVLEINEAWQPPEKADLNDHKDRTLTHN